MEVLNIIDTKFSAHDAFQGITFIRYAHSKKLESQIILKCLGAIKPKLLPFEHIEDYFYAF